MARDIFEKDVLDQLRDVRKQMATLNNTMIKIAEGMDERMDAMEADLQGYRLERLQEEIEVHQTALNKKKSTLESQSNGHSTSKTKAIVTEEVKNQLGANKIDWNKLWREKLLPAGIQFIFLALLAAIMVTIAPGLADIIARAFGG